MTVSNAISDASVNNEIRETEERIFYNAVALHFNTKMMPKVTSLPLELDGFVIEIENKTCQKCGKEAPANLKFCGGCGAKF